MHGLALANEVYHQSEIQSVSDAPTRLAILSACHTSAVLVLLPHRHRCVILEHILIASRDCRHGGKE